MCKLSRHTPSENQPAAWATAGDNLRLKNIPHHSLKRKRGARTSYASRSARKNIDQMCKQEQTDTPQCDELMRSTSHQGQISKLNSLVFFACYGHDPSTGVLRLFFYSLLSAAGRCLLLPSVATGSQSRHGKKKAPHKERPTQLLARKCPGRWLSQFSTGSLARDAMKALSGVAAVVLQGSTRSSFAW